MFEVKTDCFGYSNRGKKCTVLRETYCRKEECSFYKTREQYEADKKKYAKVVRTFGSQENKTLQCD